MPLRAPLDLAKEAFARYSERPSRLILIALVPVAAMILCGAVVGIAAFVGMFVLASIGVSYGGFIVGGIAAIPAILLFMYVSILSYPALILHIATPERFTSVRSAYEAARPLFWSLVLTSLLSMLAVIGGLLLFIIPGIIFSIWFAFAYFMVIFKGQRGAAALSASKALVKGRFWEVLYRMAAPVIPFILLGIAIGLLPGKISDVLDFVTDVISMLLTPFFAAYYYLLYLNVSENAESTPAAVETSLVSS